jgi:hypothetical protein
MNVTGLVNLLLRLLLGISIPGPLILLGMFLPYSRCVCVGRGGGECL